MNRLCVYFVLMGPRSVTVEGVAAASGVAKTTIYRRYRDRRDVLSTALSRLASPAPAGSADGHPPDRLRWLIRHAVETIEDGVGLGGRRGDADRRRPRIQRAVPANTGGAASPPTPASAIDASKSRRDGAGRHPQRNPYRRSRRRLHCRTRPQRKYRKRLGRAAVRSVLVSGAAYPASGHLNHRSADIGADNQQGVQRRSSCSAACGGPFAHHSTVTGSATKMRESGPPFR